ncbi:DMT family transporter [Salinisphaera sp.]|uniref:DMT family transporter n=1 Tax=Salinisphaera sp. TaxID=1914330 RepID=UPI002D79D721|nr:DMT family transporter [Salinisphaera sp.]HET7313844.1 DMT family transporter [Salinisphaera sp.]
MAILFGLLAALAYGASDFAAGVIGRRLGAGVVALAVHLLALLVAIASVALGASHGPTTQALAWGVAAGVGSATGTLALYRGFVVGRISVVAPLSAVVAAAVPVLTGLALGEHLSVLAGVGLVVAMPAIGLVSWQRDRSQTASARPGVAEGLVSGAGFALLFIALDRAGADAGFWPLVPGMALGSLLVLPFALKEPRPGGINGTAIGLLVAAGLFGGGANLLFLAATGRGQLSIVVVLTALYPAVTILLARVFLGEQWNNAQAAGLVAAAIAIVLITLG